MYEVHGVVAYISSQVQKVVRKFRAQIVCAHYLAQLVLGWLVQYEASSTLVIMLKQKDDSLPDMTRLSKGGVAKVG